MTIILKPLHWQFMLLLLDFCSYSVPHQILGGTFQVCNDRGSSCICMWLSLGSPSQATRKALKIQPTEWAKSRLSGQWLLGLLVLPQAGDWVNINRPKVMWACAIIGPATSPQVDSPVHSPHLLHPRYIAQEGERWAGTLNSSICCLSEPRMSNSRGPHQHLFSGCHWVLGASEGTTSLSLGTRACCHREGNRRTWQESKLWDLLAADLVSQQIPFAAATVSHRNANLPFPLPHLRASSPQQHFAVCIPWNSRDNLWINRLHSLISLGNCILFLPHEEVFSYPKL